MIGGSLCGHLIAQEGIQDMHEKLSNDKKLKGGVMNHIDIKLEVPTFQALQVD